MFKRIYLTVSFMIGLSMANQAGAVLLNPGESALFKFDLGNRDLSLLSGFGYKVTAINPPIEYLFLTDKIYDEIDGQLIGGGGAGSKPFLWMETFFSNTPQNKFLFDDPISYLKLTSAIENQSPVELIASIHLFTDQYYTIEVGEFNGVLVTGVPAPATIPLMAIGLASFGALRQRRKTREI